MGTDLAHTVGTAGDTRGPTLLALARASIAGALGLATPAPQTVCTPDKSWLKLPAASFVTLTQHGNLRGCIGSLQAHRPLLDDVQANAVAAALHDPRFVPLRAAELAETDIEVSVLSPLQPFKFTSEADALAQLRPLIDGVVFEYHGTRSTFLPQVWAQLPNARDFMAQLKRKAGLPADFWAAGIHLQHYTVAKFSEERQTSQEATR